MPCREDREAKGKGRPLAIRHGKGMPKTNIFAFLQPPWKVDCLNQCITWVLRGFDLIYPTRSVTAVVVRFASE